MIVVVVLLLYCLCACLFVWLVGWLIAVVDYCYCRLLLLSSSSSSLCFACIVLWFSVCVAPRGEAAELHGELRRQDHGR